MPGGDRTGPMGMGAMTGRAAGFCAGDRVSGYGNPTPKRDYGMGFGRGRGDWSRGFGGGGRGCRNIFYATGLPGRTRFSGYATFSGYPAAPYRKYDPEIEKQALGKQAEALQSELDFIKKRMSEIGKKTTAE